MTTEKDTARTGALILAPSASGKSTYVATLGSGLNIIDGDDIVRDDVGWPEQPNWWSDMSKGELSKFETKVYTALETYLIENPTAIVLFNGGLDLFRDADFVKGIVIPEINTHRMYAQRRAAASYVLEGEESVDARGAGNTPSLLENREKLEVFASKHDIPMYPNFTSAINAVRELDYTLGVPHAE